MVSATQVVCGLLVVAGTLWLVWNAHRLDVVRAIGLALVLIVVGSPTLWPWYLTWGVTLLAATTAQRSRVLAAVAGLAMLVVGAGGSPMLNGLDYFVTAPLLLAGCAWLLWDRHWQTVVTGAMTPEAPAGDGATDVIGGEGRPAAGVAEHADGRRTRAPPTAPQGWARQGPAVVPVLAGRRLRGRPGPHRVPLSWSPTWPTTGAWPASWPAGTGPGSCAPPSRDGHGTCRWPTATWRPTPSPSSPCSRLSIRWLSSATTLSPLAVGVIISAVTGLTAVVAVGLLVRRFAGSERATRATLLFALFPGTFAFSLVYSEGIVLTCIALGLLALLDRRWWLAGLLGLLATATCAHRPGLRPQLRLVRGLGRLARTGACARWWPPSWRRWASSPTWVGSGGTPARSTPGA